MPREASHGIVDGLPAQFPQARIRGLMCLQQAYKAVFVLVTNVFLPAERLNPCQEFREPGSAENGRFQADEPRLQVPPVPGRIEHEPEGVRAQGLHPLQVRLQRRQRPHDRIIHQIDEVIARQIRLPERPLVRAEIVLPVARGLVGDHQRGELFRLAGLQVAVRRQDDVAEGAQRLQVAERRLPHHALRVVESEQEQAFHRYGARIWSIMEPGTGSVADAPL